jgi:hypothetical protein
MQTPVGMNTALKIPFYPAGIPAALRAITGDRST